ncbi:C40 family peptidase [Rossellomorea aquimaris]|uniref:C40 family peptidase n=1 Tax=Rossellomorea aquimaris TaxID=189382 RepID=UPI001CD5CB4F|nr:C40 family peptidase [Rossellomorea aquimaris]MCA1053857.1 C40 family peptidase [Rossellomorea aquimaris]
MNNIAVVNVPVATVWTSPESARPLDAPAVTNRVNITKWLDSLTYETRLALCDENRIQSQALFGQEVLVLEEKEGWSHVIVLDQASSKDERGYPGWIPSVQLEKPASSMRHAGSFAIVTSKFADLLTGEKEKVLELSFLTSLPLTSEEGELLEVKTPMGINYVKRKDVTISTDAVKDCKGSGSDIVKSGEAFLALPYLWGGMSSYGFDCSGFSYSMCKANGYVIPRDAGDQAKEGEEVLLTDLKPGDLLFFAYEEGKGSIHHVAIYYGDGKMIHSPNTGKSIEVITIQGTYYEKELCAARRYWQETEDAS